MVERAPYSAFAFKELHAQGENVRRKSILRYIEYCYDPQQYNKMKITIIKLNFGH